MGTGASDSSKQKAASQGAGVEVSPPDGSVSHVRPSMRPTVVGPEDPAHDPLVGATLGHYSIERRLGQGGMGTVYAAVQQSLGRPVALKLIHESLALDPKVAGRFLREAKIAASLRNPHTVTIHDFGQSEDGKLYLAMELLVGEGLAQWMERSGILSPAVACEVTAQVCRSLLEAHRKGIVHRDLKPDNIFVCSYEDGSMLVKVLDYGLAWIPTEERAMDAVLTQAGTIFGTPIYMSPEQARGRTIDPRSDLYSVGVLLYEMLAGVPPFDDEDAILILSKHIREPVPPMASLRPGLVVPEELEALVRELLAKEPGGRPADVAQVMARLKPFRLGATGSLGEPGAAGPVSSRPESGALAHPVTFKDSSASAPASVPVSVSVPATAVSVAPMPPRTFPWTLVLGLLVAAGLAIGWILWPSTPVEPAAVGNPRVGSVAPAAAAPAPKTRAPAVEPAAGALPSSVPAAAAVPAAATPPLVEPAPAPAPPPVEPQAAAPPDEGARVAPALRQRPRPAAAGTPTASAAPAPVRAAPAAPAPPAPRPPAAPSLTGQAADGAGRGTGTAVDRDYP